MKKLSTCLALLCVIQGMTCEAWTCSSNANSDVTQNDQQLWDSLAIQQIKHTYEEHSISNTSSWTKEYTFSELEEQVQFIADSPANSAKLAVDPSRVLNKVRDTYVSYVINSMTDFEESKLRTMAKMLAPAICRVGGDMTDKQIYLMGDESDSYHIDSGLTGSIRAQEFLQLGNFLKEVNAQFVFGLNILYPVIEGWTLANGTDPTYLLDANEKLIAVDANQIPWNPTNAKSLLQFAINNGIEIYGLELGSAQNHKLTPQETVARLQTLDNILNELYGYDFKPKLLGPDANHLIFQTEQWPSWMMDYIDNARDLLMGVTYHEFVAIGNTNDALKARYLNRGYIQGFEMLALVQLRAPNLELWAGEIACAGWGGTPFCQSFGGSLWYMDALGMKASIGHTVFLRQDLVGPDHNSLIGPAPDFNPRASFFTAVYAKKLLGTIVLDLIQETSLPSLRTYAFCAKGHSQTGGVAIILVNIAPRSQTPVELVGSLGSNHRDEYHFTAIATHSNHIHINSPDIFLNGKKLEVDSWTGEFDLNEHGPLKRRPSDELSIAPASYSIVVIPEAQVQACLN